jgi:hypothetical protein
LIIKKIEILNEPTWCKALCKDFPVIFRNYPFRIKNSASSTTTTMETRKTSIEQNDSKCENNSENDSESESE